MEDAQVTEIGAPRILAAAAAGPEPMLDALFPGLLPLVACLLAILVRVERSKREFRVWLRFVDGGCNGGCNGG